MRTVAGFALALLLVGCTTTPAAMPTFTQAPTSPPRPTPVPATPVPATPSPTPQPTARVTASPSPFPSPTGYSADCIAEIGPVYDALTELDGRLTIGMTYDEYSERISDIIVATNRMDVEGLDATCLETALDLSLAFLEFGTAHDTWKECIDDRRCDTDSITPMLRKHWAEAERILSDVDFP